MQNSQYSQNHALQRLSATEVKDEIEGFTDRELIWAAGHILNTEPINIRDVPVSNINYWLASILEKLSNNRDRLRYITNSRHEFVIPDEHFNWLQNNERAQLFTCLLLVQNYKDNDFHFYSDLYRDKPLEFIYCFLDTQSKLISISKRALPINNIRDKVKLVNMIERKWLNIIESDKYTSWVKGSEVERIEWIYNHLNRTGKLLSINVLTIDHNNKVDLILASLDAIDTNNSAISDYEITPSLSATKKISIEKIKRAWSQKKYNNAGKTKRPYHLPLTKLSKERLDKMALINNQTPTTKLNELINNAYESEFMDKDGKEIY